MTQDIRDVLKLALDALETPWNAPYVDGCDLALGKRVKAITAIKEALAQTQEPVANDPLPRACNLAGVDYQTFLKIKAYMPVAPPQRTGQEPVAFAGIEMWVGGVRITKHITKTEFFKTREAWLLMKYSADWCLAKLKEKHYEH